MLWAQTRNARDANSPERCSPRWPRWSNTHTMTVWERHLLSDPPKHSQIWAPIKHTHTMTVWQRHLLSDPPKHSQIWAPIKHTRDDCVTAPPTVWSAETVRSERRSNTHTMTEWQRHLLSDPLKHSQIADQTHTWCRVTAPPTVWSAETQSDLSADQTHTSMTVDSATYCLIRRNTVRSEHRSNTHTMTEWQRHLLSDPLKHSQIWAMIKHTHDDRVRAPPTVWSAETQSDLSADQTHTRWLCDSATYCLIHWNTVRSERDDQTHTWWPCDSPPTVWSAETQSDLSTDQTHTRWLCESATYCLIRWNTVRSERRSNTTTMTVWQRHLLSDPLKHSQIWAPIKHTHWLCESATYCLIRWNTVRSERRSNTHTMTEWQRHLLSDPLKHSQIWAMIKHTHDDRVRAPPTVWSAETQSDLSADQTHTRWLCDSATYCLIRRNTVRSERRSNTHTMTVWQRHLLSDPPKHSQIWAPIKHTHDDRDSATYCLIRRKQSDLSADQTHTRWPCDSATYCLIRRNTVRSERRSNTHAMTVWQRHLLSDPPKHSQIWAPIKHTHDDRDSATYCLIRRNTVRSEHRSNTHTMTEWQRHLLSDPLKHSQIWAPIKHTHDDRVTAPPTVWSAETQSDLSADQTHTRWPCDSATYCLIRRNTVRSERRSNTHTMTVWQRHLLSDPLKHSQIWAMIKHTHDDRVRAPPTVWSAETQSDLSADQTHTRWLCESATYCLIRRNTVRSERRSNTHMTCESATYCLIRWNTVRSDADQTHTRWLCDSATYCLIRWNTVRSERRSNTHTMTVWQRHLLSDPPKHSQIWAPIKHTRWPCDSATYCLIRRNTVRSERRSNTHTMTVTAPPTVWSAETVRSERRSNTHTMTVWQRHLLSDPLKHSQIWAPIKHTHDDRVTAPPTVWSAETQSDLSTDQTHTRWPWQRPPTVWSAETQSDLSTDQTHTRWPSDSATYCLIHWNTVRSERWSNTHTMTVWERHLLSDPLKHSQIWAPIKHTHDDCVRAPPTVWSAETQSDLSADQTHTRWRVRAPPTVWSAETQSDLSADQTHTRWLCESATYCLIRWNTVRSERRSNTHTMTVTAPPTVWSAETQSDLSADQTHTRWLCESATYCLIRWNTVRSERRSNTHDDCVRAPPTVWSAETQSDLSADQTHTRWPWQRHLLSDPLKHSQIWAPIKHTHDDRVTAPPTVWSTETQSDLSDDQTHTRWLCERATYCLIRWNTVRSERWSNTHTMTEWQRHLLSDPLKHSQIWAMIKHTHTMTEWQRHLLSDPLKHSQIWAMIKHTHTMTEWQRHLLSDPLKHSQIWAMIKHTHDDRVWQRHLLSDPLKHSQIWAMIKHTHDDCVRAPPTVWSAETQSDLSDDQTHTRWLCDSATYCLIRWNTVRSERWSNTHTRWPSDSATYCLIHWNTVRSDDQTHTRWLCHYTCKSPLFNLLKFSGRISCFFFFLSIF